MRGKCPKCEKLVMHVNTDAIEVRSGGRTFAGVTFNCPYCSTVLSTSMDPLVLHNQVLATIQQKR
jgi:hypothetical protein